ncbi:FecR family protein [Sphingomonas sp. CJ20]
MSAEIDEAAARWRLAQAHDDMDWIAFTEWLEADPRHRDAFYEIARLDQRIDAAGPILSQLLAEPPPPRRSWPRIARWGAVAAVLVAAILLTVPYAVRAPAPVEVAIRTAPGQVRAVRLPDGSTATLAPGSVLHVPSSRAEAIRLEGAAFFDVRHDAAHPMTVRAGDYAIRDVGTRFEVSTGGGMIRVAVAEGSVAVRAPDIRDAVSVGAGQALTLTEGSTRAERHQIDTRAVGRWRAGTLVYDSVPLGLVVADIARTSGQPVTIAPQLAGRRFSGMIATGDRTAMVGALSALTGLEPRKDGDAIRLGDGAAR